MEGRKARLQSDLCYRDIFIHGRLLNESFEVIKLYIVERAALNLLKFYSKVGSLRYGDLMLKHVQKNRELSKIF